MADPQDPEGKQLEGEIVEETVVVEEKPAEEKREPVPNPRNARLAAIAKAYRQEVEGDNREAAGTPQSDRDREDRPAPDQSDEIARLREKIDQGAGDEDDAAALRELEQDADQAPEPSAEARAPSQAAPQTAGPVWVRAVVDGVAYDVPKSEIDDHGGVRAWQTNKAADNRLEAAKEVLRTARTQVRDEPPPPPQQRHQPAPPASPPPTREDEIEKLAGDLATAVTIGTDSDIKDKFKQVLTRVATSREQARRDAQTEVVATLTRAETGRTEEVLNQFIAENPELVENTTRQNAFAMAVRDLMVEDMKRHGLTDQQAASESNRWVGQNHAQMRALRSGRPIDLIYKVAADSVRRDLGFSAVARGAAAPRIAAATTTSMARRVDQKRAAASSTPAGASARAPSPTAPRKARTHEEIVREMQKQRQRHTSGAN